MRRGVRIGVLVPAALILASGCATRDWVRDFWGEKEGQIDQHFTKVEGQVGEQGQRIEGMGFRVQTLETSVKEVGDTAKGAQGRADEAYSRADGAFGRAEEVNGRLTRLWANRRARSEAEALQVQFGFNRWDINDGAQTALQSVVKELRENPKLTVDLQGYTDSTGKRDYNVQLSERRVEAVRRYLVEQGVDLPRIHYIGLGPLPDGGKREERAKNRRVTLTLMVDSD
jgi:outer membrane protein OmpA-like peptidoglycan-associated protein